MVTQGQLDRKVGTLEITHCRKSIETRCFENSSGLITPQNHPAHLTWFVPFHRCLVYVQLAFHCSIHNVRTFASLLAVMTHLKRKKRILFINELSAIFYHSLFNFAAQQMKNLGSGWKSVQLFAGNFQMVLEFFAKRNPPSRVRSQSKCIWRDFSNFSSSSLAWWHEGFENF